ncbi:EAL domain-containing protein [Sphingomonas sp. RB3P16]|uniref:putative bifunctional diguanylate cyclase/phosphodiesterase n=1 Tax=Parasphingomonas frigoris TaxID=3096163 RepID=UPI002FC65EA3
MSIEPTSQFAAPRIDARALLGLYDPADTTDWAPIRAAQVHAGGQLALFLLGANVIGAALVTLILARVAPVWMLASWSAMVAAISVAITFRRLAAKQRARTVATLADVRDTVLEGVALATIWTIPPLAFGVRADMQIALGLWIVLSVLMAASAVAMAALPLATLSFLGILGTAIAAMVLLVGGPVLAAAVLLFTLLLMIGCFTRARSLVVIRAGEIALAERDETVSLLLREAEQNDAADWLWETDAARRVVRASPRFAEAVGLDPASVNGKSLLEVLAGDSWQGGTVAPALRTLGEHLKTRAAFRGIVLPVSIGEQHRWLEVAANPRHDERGAFLGFRGVGADVTEQRASAEKINRMARFDVLTGLPNRLSINEALAQAMAAAEKWGSRCAFLMIDLDRFKAVNDTLGHPIGDRLLVRVAERLATVMSANELIGRLGGDEFAVVVRDATDTQRLERLAQAIVDALAQPFTLDHHTLYTGASVGVATGPRDGRTAEMLIRSADLALYRSKDAGGGKYHHYEPQLHVAAEERRVLEQALRSALSSDQLHLTYQPVVDAGSEQLTGFEALVRWTHPELGPISPAKFIPLAEDARLIGAIGEWVLRSACAEAATWPGDTRVAVNVSPEQLHNPGFVAVVASALANSGLPASRLELEVTESVFLRDDSGAMKVLERILALGVRLSLDDFGTGYSSLGYLSRTRFSTIKIDRSFVSGAAQNVPEAVAIIRAVVALAQSLGMATTAEGVETAEEHRLVHELGCTKVQGYYFGRPLPVDEARAIAHRAVLGREAA